MLKHIFTICCVFLSYSFLLSQERDTSYMNKLYQKAQFHLKNNQPDSTIFYATKGQQWAEEHKERAMLGDQLHLLAKAHFQKNDIPVSLRYYLQTLKVKETNSSEEELSHLHFELADLYEYWSVHGKAIQHYEHVLTDHQEGNKAMRKKALSGMARNQNLNRNPEGALDYYKQLQGIYKSENDQKKLAETLQSMIKIHKEQGNYNLALEEKSKSFSASRNPKRYYKYYCCTQ